MKNGLRVSMLFVSIVFLLVIVLDISLAGFIGRETAMASNNGAYNPMRYVAYSDRYEFVDITEENMVLEAVRSVMETKESNADIKIQILGIDVENGMIDLNVIQTVNHFNGKTTTTEERRTVIVEDK